MLVIVNPGGNNLIYQGLDTAIEPPVWARIIAGYCRDRGHEVSIVDAAAENLSPEQVAERCKGAKLVCIAAYGHQPSASTQSMESAGKIAKAVKAPNVIVGGHVAALPERTLAEEAVDYVCTGEGPATVDGLMRHEMGDGPLWNVPGLLWRYGRTEPAPLLPMRDLHGNAWDLLPMDLYRAHNWHGFGAERTPYASIHTSLGCPYKCSFCCINAPFDSNRYRMRDPSEVVGEIRMLRDRYGVRTLKIVDEMFVLNERHYTAICEGLAGLDLNIWAYARVDTVKAEKLELLRMAGIRWLALGIESGSAHVRDGAKKSLDSEDIHDVVRAIQGAGINVIGNYIFGLPDDTLETMGQTLALAKDLNCEFANLYAAMAYPGSRLYAEAAKNGTPLPKRWSGYSQHSKDCFPLPTETLSSAEVLSFRDAAFVNYFSDERYLSMIERKFGARAEIEAMLSKKMVRA